MVNRSQPPTVPVRLIAPGWFGIANVKWLRRIEVRDTPFEGRFMGRDYVTLREESRDGEMVAVETSVGRVLLEDGPGAGHADRRGLPHRWYGVGRLDRRGRSEDR